MSDQERDEAAIVAIIADMFEAISWSPSQGPDLQRFASAVHNSAVVVPSARPIAPTSISAFSERMAGQFALGEMKSFEERPLKTRVQLFGNIAVAIGGYEMSVNGGGHSRGANAFLLARDDGRWQIIGMAWDSEREGVALTSELVTI